jgi:CBS domain-containing protein
VAATGTLYDALAAMLTAGALHVAVRDGDRVVGTVSRSAIFEAPVEAAAR